MRLIELVEGFEHVLSGIDLDQGMDIAGLTCDSRDVASGFLFAALPGAHVDGRDYITSAVQSGAVCVLGPVGTEATVPVLQDDSPRHIFAQMAANFYGAQPHNIAAITGTNGKTSTASFLRQIWQHLGFNAASVGTIGVQGGGFDEPGTLTTPDPVKLHETLKRLADGGVDHLALEASSHGLEQCRLDGVQITAAGFTNISRDHLDYHTTMAEYMAAKLRLFSELTDDAGVAVVNADIPESQDVIQAAEDRGLDVITYGRGSDDIRVMFQKAMSEGQHIMMMVDGKSYDFVLPLAGKFQADNALCALGLALGLGADTDDAVAALSHLHGVPGRLQNIGSVNGADIYVDYAHTPDALETVLQALRPHTKGQLHVVFGCGGDRDKGKRPQMGAIAETLADHIIITDDNPRTEDAATIRKEILAAAPGAEDIGDRHLAIVDAVRRLQDGDVLVLAGKGHEQGQSVGDAVLPFDDVEQAQAAMQEVEA